MAVVATALVSDGVFTPFRTTKRGGEGGQDPVGTLYVDAGATGAAGGGTVLLTIAMSAVEFGFSLLWVPTLITISDNLAAAEDVQFGWQATGNDRISTFMATTVPMLRAAGINAGQQVQTGMLIDGFGSDLAIMSVTWDTNTDTKIYHLHVFGPVYDGELLAKGDKIPELLAGLR